MFDTVGKSTVRTMHGDEFQQCLIKLKSPQTTSLLSSRHKLTYSILMLHLVKEDDFVLIYVVIGCVTGCPVSYRDIRLCNRTAVQ